MVVPEKGLSKCALPLLPYLSFDGSTSLALSKSITKQTNGFLIQSNHLIYFKVIPWESRSKCQIDLGIARFVMGDGHLWKIDTVTFAMRDCPLATVEAF